LADHQLFHGMWACGSMFKAFSPFTVERNVTSGASIRRAPREARAPSSGQLGARQRGFDRWIDRVPAGESPRLPHT
jgi:hypothetical protein